MGIAATGMWDVGCAMPNDCIHECLQIYFNRLICMCLSVLISIILRWYNGKVKFSDWQNKEITLYQPTENVLLREADKRYFRSDDSLSGAHTVPLSVFLYDRLLEAITIIRLLVEASNVCVCLNLKSEKREGRLGRGCNLLKKTYTIMFSREIFISCFKI